MLPSSCEVPKYFLHLRVCVCVFDCKNATYVYNIFKVAGNSFLFNYTQAGAREKEGQGEE